MESRCYLVIAINLTLSACIWSHWDLKSTVYLEFELVDAANLHVMANSFVDWKSRRMGMQDLSY